MPEHPQVYVELEVKRANIDEGIAPLILEIWKAGLNTANSCQDNHGRVWIEFATVSEGEAFLDAIAKYEEPVDSLYNRISKKWVPRDPDECERWLSEESWEYDVHVFDLNVQEEITEDGADVREYSTGPARFRFSLSVRFPQKDLAEVQQRLAGFNEQNERKRLRITDEKE